MTGNSYLTSAQIAKEKAHSWLQRQRSFNVKVMKQHRKAVDAISKTKVPTSRLRAKTGMMPSLLRSSVIAMHRLRFLPTTIGLLMDCDTTGIDFSLVKFETGWRRIFQDVNQVFLQHSMSSAILKIAGAIIEFATGTMHFKNTPHINEVTLKAKGFTDAELTKITAALPGAFSLLQAFGSKSLKDLGFTDAQINEANDVICGRMTVEGAPFLKAEHMAVFDCANKCGKTGTRYIAPLGHIKMMGAAQPFLSDSKPLTFLTNVRLKILQKPICNHGNSHQGCCALSRWLQDGQPLLRLIKRQKKEESSGSSSMRQLHLLQRFSLSPRTSDHRASRMPRSVADSVEAKSPDTKCTCALVNTLTEASANLRRHA